MQGPLEQEKSRTRLCVGDPGGKGQSENRQRLYSSLVGCFQFFVSLYLLPPFSNLPKPPSPRSLARIHPFQKVVPKAAFPSIQTAL